MKHVKTYEIYSTKTGVIKPALPKQVLQNVSTLDITLPATQIKKYPNLSQLICDSVQRIRAIGFVGHIAFEIDRNYFIKNYDLPKLTNGIYDDVKNVVCINPDGLFYENDKIHSAEDVMKSLYGSFWKSVSKNGAKTYSTEDNTHTIIHEIGHYLHYNYSLKSNKVLMKKIDSGKLGTPASSLELKKPANRVSDYAMKSWYEFVAEVFAGLVCGVRYPPEVMKLYFEFYGPMTPQMNKISTKLNKSTITKGI